jgi:hypothetical protein
MGYYDRRDLIGHFVRKSRPAQQMCNHACCRGYRVHPKNFPVILPSRLLRRASDDDLAAHFAKVAHSDETDDVAARWQMLAEFERRDMREAARRRAAERHQARVRSRRSERQEAVEHAWRQAETATNGYMLNRAGLANNIDERSLFTGPESRARRYASEELLQHWQTHPRPTSAMFAGKDTRVYEKATPRRARQYGTKPVTSIQKARARRLETAVGKVAA